MSTFGEKLSKIRGLIGYNQQELAKLAKINLQTLSRYETGSNTNPGLETLKRLSEALGITVCDLIDDEKEIKITKSKEKIILKVRAIQNEDDLKKIDLFIDFSNKQRKEFK